MNVNTKIRIPEDLMPALLAKQAKNFARTWPVPTSEDEAVEHDRSGEAKQSAPATECAAFESWARGQGYDMRQHPLHYLFLDPKTNAARQGWNALRAELAAANERAEKAEEELRLNQIWGTQTHNLLLDAEEERDAARKVLGEAVEALRKASRVAERGYGTTRSFIDESVPEWTRGDDGPIYWAMRLHQDLTAIIARFDASEASRA